jgi:hypothetical protein
MAELGSKDLEGIYYNNCEPSKDGICAHYHCDVT